MRKMTGQRKTENKQISILDYDRNKDLADALNTMCILIPMILLMHLKKICPTKSIPMFDAHDVKDILPKLKQK